MRPLLLALAVLAAPAAAPAHAASFDYRGGCGFQIVNDPTDRLFGDDGFQHGPVYLAVVPTDSAGVPSGATATVWCELVIEGVSQGTVLGPTTGTGLVVDLGQLVYTAAVDQQVKLCTHVTVGTETIVRCAPVEQPDPVRDLVDLLPPVDDWVDVVNDLVFGPLDPVICAGLVALAPVVNDAALGLVTIDPVTGDTFVVGELFWDCPPYVS